MVIPFIVALFYCFIVPQSYSTVMLDCALGLVEEARCPVDGGWTLWSLWSTCEGECGMVGRQMRTRNCTNPPPLRNGLECSGDQRQVKQCSVPGCNYDQYAALLVRDSLRLIALKRLAELAGAKSAILTKCLTAHCDFSTVSEAFVSVNVATKFWNDLQCVKKNTGCPVAGGWGEWSSWTRCSARCGPGQQTRCRVCCEPRPSNPDQGCPGESCVYQPCIGTDCVHGWENEGSWSDWSQWSSCNRLCNFGLMRRSRVCKKGKRQNQKRKILLNYSPSVVSSLENPYMTNDYDYYGNYLYSNYEENIDSSENHYEEDNGNLWNTRGKRSKVCDKTEYYFTEDEDYSTYIVNTLRHTKPSLEVTSIDKENEQILQTILPSSEKKDLEIFSEKTIKTVTSTDSLHSHILVISPTVSSTTDDNIPNQDKISHFSELHDSQNENESQSTLPIPEKTSSDFVVEIMEESSSSKSKNVNSPSESFHSNTFITSQKMPSKKYNNLLNQNTLSQSLDLPNYLDKEASQITLSIPEETSIETVSSVTIKSENNNIKNKVLCYSSIAVKDNSESNGNNEKLTTIETTNIGTTIDRTESIIHNKSKSTTLETLKAKNIMSSLRGKKVDNTECQESDECEVELYKPKLKKVSCNKGKKKEKNLRKESNKNKNEKPCLRVVPKTTKKVKVTKDRIECISIQPEFSERHNKICKTTQFSRSRTTNLSTSYPSEDTTLPLTSESISSCNVEEKKETIYYSSTKTPLLSSTSIDSINTSISMNTLDGEVMEKNNSELEKTTQFSRSRTTNLSTSYPSEDTTLPLTSESISSCNVEEKKETIYYSSTKTPLLSSTSIDSINTFISMNTLDGEVTEKNNLELSNAVESLSYSTAAVEGYFESNSINEELITIQTTKNRKNIDKTELTTLNHCKSTPLQILTTENRVTLIGENKADNNESDECEELYKPNTVKPYSKKDKNINRGNDKKNNNQLILRDSPKEECISYKKPEYSEELYNTNTLLSSTMIPLFSQEATLQSNTKPFSSSNEKETLDNIFYTNIETSTTEFSSSTSLLSSTKTPKSIHALFQDSAQEDRLELISESENISTLYQQSTCDLKNVLQLPNFNDSFSESENCKGQFEQIKACNTHSCDKAGGWSSWSAWSACVPECGLGRQVSTRTCTNPQPSSSGGTCLGDTSWKRSCYQQPCPVKVETSRAMLMSSRSLIKYERQEKHASLLMLYLRFRPYNSSGTLVKRSSIDSRVSLSLYNSHVLLVVEIESCIGHIVSSQHLEIGEWHEVLLTVVGAIVRLRVDDSVLTHQNKLSCLPLNPDYDMHMTVGGQFVGEVDKLSVNFRNYAMQKQHTKRDIWTDNEGLVMPSETPQVQYKLNSEEMQSASLAHFLYTPCFANNTSWRMQLAIKPQIDDGLVLFLHGYDKNEFLFVTLEQTRIRLRVKHSAISGECEQSITVSPQMWLLITLSKQVAGPIGLSVNGGVKCVVSLAEGNDTEEPIIHCNGGVYMGEVPFSVKNMLASDSRHSEPLHSPLGLLGRLAVDNQPLDLTKLQRKMSPDLLQKHSSNEYLFSSHSASSTVYYKEMIVLQGEPLTLLCLYDLSKKETVQGNLYDRHHDQDDADYTTNWLKLDQSVETAFQNSSRVKYQILDNGRSTTLNISWYSSKEEVEGFYSCWLHYPLPQQQGLNIITYGIMIISNDEDIQNSLNSLIFYHVFYTVFMLFLFIIWLMVEGLLDYHNGSGFYRCGTPSPEENYKLMDQLIFSDESVHLLGGIDKANEAMNRYEAYAEAETLARAVERAEKRKEAENREAAKNQDKEYIELDDINMLSVTDDDQTSVDYIMPNARTVNLSQVKQNTPFKNNQIHEDPEASYSGRLRYQPGKMRERAGGSDDNFIEVSRIWTQKEVENHANNNSLTEKQIGLIQNTSAFRNIESELKFKPEKRKGVEKFQYLLYQQNNKET